VLGDPELAHRFGAAARHTARETFSLERTVAETLQLYQGILDPDAVVPPRRLG